MSDVMRFATLEDAQAILDIYAPYVLNTNISFEEKVPSLKDFKQRINDTHPWLVYVRNGHVIAYAYASPFNPRSAYDWTVQTSIYVQERYQGLGIGVRLYVALLDVLTTLGYVNAYALIVSPNEKSEKMHRSLGFKPGPLFKKVGYKLKLWHDLHWYTLELNPPTDHPARPRTLKDPKDRFTLEQRLLNIES